MSRSFLHGLPRKNPNPQLIPSLSFATRIFTPLKPNPDPNPNPFPDRPTAAYYDDLVNAAGRDHDFNRLRYLLNKRVRDHCFNTTNTFKFIANTPASLSALDGVVLALSRLDKGYPRRSAFETLVARLCRLERVDDALRTVDFMAREGCELRACCFHPILNVLARKEEEEEAWGVVEKMRGLGVPPDLTAYNYLLTAYCAGGRLTEAAKVMGIIRDEGLGADSRTYDALVLGACRAGKVEGAMVVMRRMEEDGVPVLYSTYAHVINALLGLGYYEQAVKFVMIFGGKDKALDSENFGILASKLIKLKRIKEARFVLEEMEKRGLVMGEKLREFYNLNGRSGRLSEIFSVQDSK